MGKMEVSKEERALVRFCRRVGWGEFEVLVQNGEPKVIRRTIKTVRLEDLAEEGSDVI